MKNTKKIICFLCCLLLIFSCSTISWSPHADAAAPIATYVASVVGSFILSAGFSFDNRGDFQSATEAFLESDVARGITEITTHIGNICALGNISEPLLIHELINAGFFKDFWNSIYDFFGRGDITVDLGGIPAPPDGYAYYNDVLLPLIKVNSSLLDIIYYDASDATYIHRSFTSFSRNPMVYVATNSAYQISVSGNYYDYSFTVGSNDWVKEGYYTKTWGNFQVNSENYSSSSCSLIWVNVDLGLYSGSNGSQIGVFMAGSIPVTEGTENVDVIGVYNNEVYTPTDIINSWERVAENGGTIDWALDSIPAYGDITSGDKDAPVTQTQSGVLTQSGVKVQTDEEVKQEVIEGIKTELKGYEVVGLTSIFPFCIPFDIYNFLSVLVADREAPHFEFVLDFGALGVQEMEVDLSSWETAAQILRTLELMAFCIGLALATSKLIKW